MRPLRGRAGAKYADMNVLRQAMADSRVWAVKGIVWKPPDADNFYRIVDGEILVEVQSTPGKLDLTCSLSTVGGGSGAGFWAVPPLGTQVLVLLPDAAVDFAPAIVAILSTDGVPERAAAGRTVLVSKDPIEIIAPTVTITDTEGGLELATKADLAALRSWIISTMQIAGATPGTVSNGPTAPTAAGTSILRAK
jgi:hypothetical protein